MDIQSIITLIHAVSDSKIKNFEIEEGNFRLTMDKIDSRFPSSLDKIGPVPMNVVYENTRPITPTPAQIESVMVQQPTPAMVGEINTSLVEAATQTTPASTNMITNKEQQISTVCSPIVGTFYSSSGPDSEDFVKVGTKVKKGQVLCIIEAMKLMNEIESEYDGELVEILIQNEEMVEYNQPLFKIKVES